MSSDSTWFDMRDVPLKPALEIAFSTSPSNKAWGYKSTPERLTFAWNLQAQAVDSEFVPFVTPIDAERALVVVSDWLREVAKFDGQPDHDGDNGRSCRIFCEAWGYIDHNHYTFAAVEPYWAQYGK